MGFVVSHDPFPKNPVEQLGIVKVGTLEVEVLHRMIRAERCA